MMLCSVSVPSLFWLGDNFLEVRGNANRSVLWETEKAITSFVLRALESCLDAQDFKVCMHSSYLWSDILQCKGMAYAQWSCSPFPAGISHQTKPTEPRAATLSEMNQDCQQLP